MNILKRIKRETTNLWNKQNFPSLAPSKEKFFVLIGLTLAIYQIWSVLFAKLDPINQMAIHLSLILMLTFFLYSFSKKTQKNKFDQFINTVLIILAGSAGAYYTIHAERIATRTVGIDALTTMDILFGLIFVVLSIEAARRTIGSIIIIVALSFIAYALFGHLLSGIWYHYEISPVEVLDQLAFSLNGLWGSPIAVASSFVFIFVLFGSFLQNSGASEFFFRLSIAIAGRTRGGAAKIAIIASAFFGAISGSPTANVVTTGPFTIPMAKKLGYSPRFAAAVEACASTGGSLLPPIMGSSAFLMTAVTGLPYSTIAIAAILPGILYYVSLFSIVHFEALRIDLPRANKKDIPEMGSVLKEGWHHFIPVIVLIVLLYNGSSPSVTGIYGIITIVVLSWFTKKHKMGIRKLTSSLITGAKSAIPISTACATAGLVIAGIMSTGLGGKLSSIVLNVANGKVLPSLLLIMTMCIVLGMGMPVAAAYVLTAMLAAPTLIDLGVSMLAAHLFIVYFSIISAITPPVAVAAFAAAGLAEEKPTKVSIEAVRIGLVSFIIPFVFVFNSALLMDGTLGEIVYAFLSTTVGIIVFSCGIVGFFHTKLKFMTRSLLFLLGMIMIYPNIFVNVIGFTIIACLLMRQQLQSRLSKSSP